MTGLGKHFINKVLLALTCPFSSRCRFQMRMTLLLSAGALLAMSAGADGKARSLLPGRDIEPLTASVELSGQAADHPYETRLYRHGATYQILELDAPVQCEAACAGEASCLAWSFVESDGTAGARCELKRGAGRLEENRLATSGVRPARTATVLSLAPAADRQQGVSDLAASARSGDAEAAYQLAGMYESGEGVPADPGQARYWTSEAARLGHRRSMHDLAVYMIEGEGGQSDINGAVEWFTKAALKGEVDSQFNLALLLLSRADQNPDTLAGALYWLLIAAENGDAMAADKSAEVAVLLPPDMVDAIRSEAAAFTASNS